MSSTNVNTVLTALLAEMKTLNGRISALEGLVSSKPSAPAAAAAGKPKKEKKAKESGEDKPKREPTAWRLFADRVRETLREAGFEGKSLGTECVQFCSSLKEENADFASWSESDILARRAAWTAPEVSKQKAAGKSWRKSPSGSAAASVVSDADGAAATSDGGAAPAKKARKNPWEGLSPEEKAERIAKMKAGRESKKAAVSEAAPEDEAPPSDGEAPSVTSSEKKKRGPKKHADMNPLELAADKAKRAAKKAAKEAAKTAEAPAASGAVAAASASLSAARMPLPASPVSSHSDGGFQRVMLLGAPYWVNLKSGHCYHRLADGGQGEWAGLFHRTPKPHIDDSVPEPVPEDDGFVLEDW